MNDYDWKKDCEEDKNRDIKIAYNPVDVYIITIIMIIVIIVVGGLINVYF